MLFLFSNLCIPLTPVKAVLLSTLQHVSTDVEWNLSTATTVCQCHPRSRSRAKGHTVRSWSRSGSLQEQRREGDWRRTAWHSCETWLVPENAPNNFSLNALFSQHSWEFVRNNTDNGGAQAKLRSDRPLLWSERPARRSRKGWRQPPLRWL